MTHLLSGAAAGAWLAVAFTPAPGVALAGVALGAAAAMTPDLDHPSARAVRRLGFVGLGLCWIIRTVSRITTGTEHRGLSHSFAFALALGLGAWALAGLALDGSQSLYLGVSVVVGVVAALLGDLVTISGLHHLMWPLGTQVSVPQWMRIRTNGPFEHWVVFPLVALATVAGVLQIGGVLTVIMERIGHA